MKTRVMNQRMKPESSGGLSDLKIPFGSKVCRFGSSKKIMKSKANWEPFKLNQCLRNHSEVCLPTELQIWDLKSLKLDKPRKKWKTAKIRSIIFMPYQNCIYYLWNRKIYSYNRHNLWLTSTSICHKNRAFSIEWPIKITRTHTPRYPELPAAHSLAPRT